METFSKTNRGIPFVDISNIFIEKSKGKKRIDWVQLNPLKNVILEILNYDGNHSNIAYSYFFSHITNTKENVEMTPEKIICIDKKIIDNSNDNTIITVSVIEILTRKTKISRVRAYFMGYIQCNSDYFNSVGPVCNVKMHGCDLNVPTFLIPADKLTLLSFVIDDDFNNQYSIDNDYTEDTNIHLNDFYIYNFDIIGINERKVLETIPLQDIIEKKMKSFETQIEISIEENKISTIFLLVICKLKPEYYSTFLTLEQNRIKREIERIKFLLKENKDIDQIILEHLGLEPKLKEVTEKLSVYLTISDFLNDLLNKRFILSIEYMKEDFIKYLEHNEALFNVLQVYLDKIN